MEHSNDLIDRALDAWGTFYKAALPTDHGTSYSGIYRSDELVSAVTETQTTDATFTVEVTPQGPSDSQVRRPPFDAPVEVYLDSSLIATSGWHSVDGDWMTWARVNPETWLRVSIQGRWGEPPATLEIVRDRPAA